MKRPETASDYAGRDLEAMSAAVNYHKWILEEFEPYLGDSVAEVGAGMGSMSELLLGKDIKRLFAFEPSLKMYELLEKALREEVRATPVNGFFSRQFTGHQFDSVLYINVLEHIEDDGAELATAFTCLRPGGNLLIFVPALPWLYSGFDKEVGHFRRYTRDGLKALVSVAGFNIIRARYFDIAGVLPWYVNFVLLGNSMLKGSVALYDNLAVPVMKVVEGIVSPPLGKNVLLVAKKPGG